MPTLGCSFFLLTDKKVKSEWTKIYFEVNVVCLEWVHWSSQALQVCRVDVKKAKEEKTKKCHRYNWKLDRKCFLEKSVRKNSGGRKENKIHNESYCESGLKVTYSKWLFQFKVKSFYLCKEFHVRFFPTFFFCCCRPVWPLTQPSEKQI